MLLDLNGFKTYNDSFGHGAGDMLLARLGEALGDAIGADGDAYRMGGDEFCVLAPLTDGLDALSARCAAALATRGEASRSPPRTAPSLLPDEGRDPSIVLALADARMYRQKNARPPAGRGAVGRRAPAVVAERAPGLASHVAPVCELACAAAAELGIAAASSTPSATRPRCTTSARWRSRESILEKPGPLTDAEWALDPPPHADRRADPRRRAALERSARLVRWSHERIDGTGYPDGLAGEEIPLGSRIILVADAFDAMVSKRSYGAVLTEADALAELRRCAAPSSIRRCRRVRAGARTHPRVADPGDRPRRA